MGKHTVLLWFLCFLPVSIRAVCVGIPPPNDFPALPDSYQTVIEINVDNRNYSILEREYRDGVGKRRMTSQMRDNMKHRVIMDENIKQAFHINETDRTCRVTGLYTRDTGDYPFGWSSKNMKQFLYSTESVYAMVKHRALFSKMDVVRGISVQNWCTEFKFQGRDLELQMYFADPSWKTSGGYKMKPVRFVLTENSTKADALSHNYEYYTFYQRVKDNPMSVFETPRGVICKGRKGSKKIPKLPMYFSYRQEVVYDESVKISDVWYDEKHRRLRIDYRPGGIEKSMSAALSEIHDYNTGVLYTKNLYLGNCSASTITNSSFGSEMNVTSWKKDNSYEVMLKNPLQYFYLDSNYTYVGKKLARQIKCDVFSTTRKSFMMPNGRKYPVVLEFYFASKDYTILPDKANNITSKVPVMLLVSAADSVSLRINIVDFNEQQHDFSIYDVSSCYSAPAKMHITILMEGQYVESTREEIIGEAQVTIADLMQISINRVQHVAMSHDADAIALYASILDRTLSAAQFSHVSFKTQTVGGDARFNGVNTMADCADKCVESTAFVCNSFDLCGNDCILSKTHIASKVTSGGTVLCDHYSRTVDGPKIKELNLKSAWNNLLKAIGVGSFILDIPNDTGDSEYKAIFARLDNGVLQPLIDIPKLRDNLRYKEEIVSPSSKVIEPISVYYDASKNLTRFDSWVIEGCTFCSGPVETVQDFQLGVQYIINKETGECHPEHIQEGMFDVINEDPAKMKLLKMKDPLGLFYIDGTYSFVGQKDVRGIMTDIFEAWRTDFPSSKDVLFRYYFLSQSWNSTSAKVPMKLEIVSDLDAYNSVYNIYEFVEEPVPMSNFDVTECYRELNHIVDFQITFDGVYRQQPANFILAVINQIKKDQQISGIRIQEPEVSYDQTRTYFQASLLEAPPSITMFNQLSGISSVVKPENVVKNVQSAEACADQCVNATNILCNAFQYCRISKRCELHTKHFGDSHKQASETCSFYTRTEDAPFDMIPAKKVLIDLTNRARKGLFKISFNADQTDYTFTAKSVLTNIDRDNSKDIASVLNMESYNRSFDGGRFTEYGSTFLKVSVDDCASRCTQSQALNCEAFSYCYLEGTCLLSEKHPTNNTVEITMGCDIYERTYLSSFEVLPGRTFPMRGTNPLVGVKNAETCARACYNDGVRKCQSFEFCESMNSCAFSKEHTMDIPNTDIVTSAKCSVYSLTFLNDFKKASTKVEDLVDNVLIKNVSAKQCAQICLRDQGLTCSSFDYCPSDRICRITGIDEARSGHESGPTHLNCSHYIRSDGVHLPNPFAAKMIKGNKGTAAGLGIGMFILGTLLGILVIFLVHRRGSSSSVDGMKVNFLKLEGQ